jgi:hypothetical protein
VQSIVAVDLKALGKRSRQQSAQGLRAKSHKFDVRYTAGEDPGLDNPPKEVEITSMIDIVFSG